MATVSSARLQEHKARDRCALCATRRAELDDLNLHVKSPPANDLASRFGRSQTLERTTLSVMITYLWKPPAYHPIGAPHAGS
jgi:hypothetical protein